VSEELKRFLCDHLKQAQLFGQVVMANMMYRRTLSRIPVSRLNPHDASQTENWPNPQIMECVAGKIRILSYTQEPHFIQRNKHLCRARLTCCSEESPLIADDIYEINQIVPETKTHASHFSAQVVLDPDGILDPDIQSQFKDLLFKFSDVFTPDLTGYNGAIGPFEASVNMCPVQPPQLKGRMPQYSKQI
jgi:hypothetical protein